MESESRRTSVSDYYGKHLKSCADLRTSTCCPSDAVPEAHKEILSKLHPETISRFYGCGSPVPDSLEGATVLDIGCGTGRDAYLTSPLVGPSGKVIGIDMTDSQLELARQHQDYHARVLLGEGIPSNVEFRKGIIEDLRACGIEDESVDIVISNCVCNLCANKLEVWREVARVLKEGGEFYFSDTYADRRLSPEAQAHEVLVGECLGGALYLEDYRRIMKEAGFSDIRFVSSAPIEVIDKDLAKLVPDVKFFSITSRAFKIKGLEDRREDYGQTATLVSDSKTCVRLDVDNFFSKGAPVPVDANTALMLQKSRYAKLFKVTEKGPHAGLFYQRVEGGAVYNMLAKALPNSASSKLTGVANGTSSASQDASASSPCCGPSGSKERDGAANVEEKVTKSGCC